MPATLVSPALCEPAGTLLGSWPAALTLRVCGGPHRDRLVKIQAAKCTVGSAAGCTLRLRAEGVAPLHCWILRGARGAVIRRATGHTLLNGRTYQDSPLRPGDRLVVGSVELEIVDCQATIVEPTAPPALPVSSPELEASLIAANEEIVRLKSDAQQAWQTSIVASERAEQMCEALERANVELGEIRAELEAAHGALNRRSDIRHVEEQRARCKQLEELLYESQRELGSTREGLQQALGSVQERSALADRLQADCAGRDQRIAVLERELAEAVQAARGPVTVAMGDLQAELEQQRQLQERYAALERQVGELQSELHAERQATHVQREAAATAANSLAHSEQQVQQLRAEAQQRAGQQQLLQSQVDSLEQQLQQSQSVGDGLRRQVESLQRQGQDLQRQIEPLLAEAEQARARQTEFDNRAAELEGRAAELNSRTAELDVRTAAVATREADCDAWRQSLDARQAEQAATRQQQAEREASLGEKEALLTRQAQSLQEELDRTAQKQAELNELKSHLSGISADESARQKQLEDLAAELATRSENLDEREARLSRHHQELEEQHSAWRLERAAHDRAQVIDGDAKVLSDDDLALEIPTAGAQAEPSVEDPGGVDSVLSRLVKSGLWREEQGDSPAEGAEASIPASAKGKQPEEASKAPGAQAATAAANHGEESIESYMARLMNRVRPDGGKSNTASAASVPSTPAPAEVQPNASLPAAADQRPVEYLPRSSAKELSGDLATMREVANTVARSAIAAHQQKHTKKKRTQNKLQGGTLVMLISLAGGYWAWRSGSVAAFAGAFIGLAVAATWSLLGLRRMLQALRLQQPGPSAPEGELDPAPVALVEPNPPEQPA